MFLSFAEFPSQLKASQCSGQISSRARGRRRRLVSIASMHVVRQSLPCCHEENKCLMILEKDFAIGCPAVEGRRGRVIARR